MLVASCVSVCSCLRVTRMAWLPGGRWAPDSSDSAWNAGYATERMASALDLLNDGHRYRAPYRPSWRYSISVSRSAEQLMASPFVEKVLDSRVPSMATCTPSRPLFFDVSHVRKSCVNRA